MKALEVIQGRRQGRRRRQWSIDHADRLEWFASLPPDSVDLVFGSPPYEDARTYGIGFKLRGQAWVDWMVATYLAARRCCRGMVAFVLEGKTIGRRWSAVPALLMADLHRAGLHLRKPPIFHRVGIPGSGGKRVDHSAAGGSADGLRNDYEFIVCTTRGGKLPWADTLAMGHPPKWAPGGEMSNRLSDGTRVNQLDAFGGTAHVTSGVGRRADGSHKPRSRKDHHEERSRLAGRRVATGHKNGDITTGDSYTPPAIANPGNVLHYKVGGGLMGHALAHENEAPFPLDLAEFFVRAFCRPNGIAADCFCGSGTVAHACLSWGRRFIGCDVRPSQVDLTTRRMAGITPPPGQP